MSQDKELNKPDEQNANSRRDFLRVGLALGLGTAAGGAAILAGYKEEAAKTQMFTNDGHVVKLNSDHVNELQKDEPLSLNELQRRGRAGFKGKRWVMVIDLASCRNARKCMSACNAAHHLKPEQHHINVYRLQEDEHTAPYFEPKPCMQCDNPPCTKVCPVDATFKREDGIVLIDNERCIGCRFCVAACPYSARVFNWSEPKKVAGDDTKVYDIELNVPQKKGTITKCIFSADRLRIGKLPYCVSACPNGVYWFGDANEDVVTNGTSHESVRFSELLEKNAGYTLLPELGTKPRVFYLPPKNRLFPFEYKGKKTLSKDDDPELKFES